MANRVVPAVRPHSGSHNPAGNGEFSEISIPHSASHQTGIASKFLQFVGLRSNPLKKSSADSVAQELLCVIPIPSDYEDLKTFVVNQRFLREENTAAVGPNVRPLPSL